MLLICDASAAPQVVFLVSIHKGNKATWLLGHVAIFLAEKIQDLVQQVNDLL